MGKRCEPPSSDKITQIRDSDEKYKQIDTYAQTRPRSGSKAVKKARELLFQRIEKYFI
ncbi:12651_t:CDS:2, partial [Entrophospora sp. SA101]